jgi:thiol-disulfide isomerase/thioredoxin
MTRKAGATLFIVLMLPFFLRTAGHAAAAPTLQVGDAAPAFTLHTLDGKTISRETLKGKVAVLDFWATWCVPCRKALPELKELRQKNAGQPLVVVSVSADEDRKSVEEFVRQNGMDWPQAWDGKGTVIGGIFGVQNLPTYVVLDANGTIAYGQRGWAPVSSARLLDQAVTKALATVTRSGAAAGSADKAR